MLHLAIAMAVSLGAVGLFLLLSQRQSGLGVVAVLAVVGAVLGVLTISPGFFSHMALTVIVAVVCLALQPRRAWVVGLLLVAPLVGYSFWLHGTSTRLGRRAALREEYPLVSLADRLSYERRPVGEVALPADLPAEHPSRMRDYGSYSPRREMLEQIYDRSHDDFIIATGFGAFRMGEVFGEMLVLDDAGPISLKDYLSCEPAGIAEEAPPEARLPSEPDLADMHKSGLKDFLKSERFGYVQDRKHVAGFQSHRYDKMPQPADDPHRRWALVRLELIGLLKYEHPKAYVSENLPRLGELGEAATRELDEFEQAALVRLRNAEDLVIDESPDRIRMLGSLRAGHDCRECHSVRLGELLGAMSYEIVPLEQARDALAARAPATSVSQARDD